MSIKKNESSIMINYGDSFYDVEATETDFWSWSHEKEAELSIDNTFDKEVTCIFSAEIFPAPKEESQMIKLCIESKDEEVIIAPCKVVRTIVLAPKERIIIRFISETDSKEIDEDPRKFNFSINNLKVEIRDIVSDMYVHWLNSERTIGYYLENGFYEIEKNEWTQWQWTYSKEAVLRFVNRLPEMNEYTLNMQFESITDTQGEHLWISQPDETEEFELPCNYTKEIQLIPQKDYVIRLATDNISKRYVNGDCRLLNFCVRDIKSEPKQYVNQTVWAEPKGCIGIQLDDCFYGREALDGKVWNWSHEKNAVIKVYNSSDKEQKFFLQFELIQAPNEEKRKIKITINEYAEIYEAPDVYEKYLSLEPWETQLIFLEGLGEAVKLDKGDTRTFYFCIQNIQCTEGKEKPEGELDAIKAVQLDLLNIVEQFSNKCGVKYCLFYGALLGAVRHQGIIPWDDDIDVALLREDYDRLIKYMEEHLEYPYAIQTHRNDLDCFYGGYAKLRNSNTTGIDVKNFRGKANKGIWIDIFPLDVLTLDEAKRYKQIKKIRDYQNLLYAQIYGLNMRNVVGNVSMFTCLISWFRSMFYTKKGISKRLEDSFKLHNDEQSPYVAVMARYLGLDKQNFFCREWFEDLMSVPFEKKNRYIPKAYRKCLDILYGKDYEVLPKQSVRKPHHEAIYDINTPYQDYVKRFVEQIEFTKAPVTILCGRGELFEKCIRMYKKKKMYLINMEKTSGGYFLNGHMVLGLSDLVKMESQSYQLIICDYDYISVEKKLNEAGIREYKIYCTLDVIKSNNAEA